MNEQKNLVIAVLATLVILLGFNYFYERPKQLAKSHEVSAVPKEITPIAEVKKSLVKLDRPEALAATPRVTLENAEIRGSVNLRGGVIDDIVLKKFREDIHENSPLISLMNPQNSKDGYYCEFNWLSQNSPLLDSNIEWKSSTRELIPGQPLVLTYDNGRGLLFERTFILDDAYLFTVQDKVTNKSKEKSTLKPFAQIVRQGTPKTGGYFILHEGPIGVLNGKLQEIDYQKLVDKGPQEQTSQGGWLGITDKYWLVALVPQPKVTVNTWFRGNGENADAIFTSGYTGESVELAPGQSIEYKHHLFTGAKKLSVLDGYERKQGFEKFHLAVDFGWFYFLTKPLFYILEFLNSYLGNLGLAILGLTVLFKIALYPMAAKSFHSMARMKKIQPQMEKIKERYRNDKVRMQQELMEFYKREKINPVSGCLPMLLQAPIFFCLYKVLFVTIEMRQAPFYGWIHDLSAPDPTTIFNLFGLLPWIPPSFLMIGAWPLIMGLTMYLQQKMSPQPADPAQAKAMLMMPIFITFLLAQFPAGLVIYWAWTNILSIVQQWYMMRTVKA